MIIFKSIRPATQFRSSIFRDELRAAAQVLAPRIQADFEKTTRTWKDKPEFETSVKVGNVAGGALAKSATGSASGVSVEVTTDDEIYGYVDEGTRPHLIRPKRKGGLLAFKTGGYRAKTKPRVIGSTAGKPGRSATFAKAVHHPGTKARLFTQTIRKKWTKDFRTQMDKALQTAARRSGHAMPTK